MYIIAVPKKSKVKQCNQHRFLREERFAEQIKQYVQKISLSNEWQDKFLKRIAVWEKTTCRTSELFIQNLKIELVKIKTKINRLLDAHLEGVLEIDEYQEKKNALLEQKTDLKQKIKDFERKENHWVELIRNWVLASNQAKNLASTENFPEMKNFLKKIGLNRTIKNQKLCISFKKPWNYLYSMTAEARASGEGEAECSSNSLWWP